MNLRRYLKQNAVQASLLLMVAALLSRILGLTRDILFSAYFGTSYAADALNATLPITLVIQNVTTSAIAVSFIPLFVGIINKSKKETVHNFNVVFNYILLGLFLCILLIVVFSFPLVHILTPGFKAIHLIHLTAKLVDAFAIVSLFWAITNFLYALAQSYKNFLITATVPLILNTSIIIGLILWHKSLGVLSYTTGMLIGTIIQTVIMLFYTRNILHINFAFDFNPRGTILGPLLVLSIPLIVQQLSTYAVTVVSNNVASRLTEGSIASLGYANKLRQFALGVLTVPLATSYYPFLSEAVVQNDTYKLREIFSKSIRFASFFIVPVTLIFIVFSRPIVAIVFQRGAFGLAAVSLTASPLEFYSLGIFPAMYSIVCMRTFFAMKDMWTPTILSIITATFNIAIINPLVKIYANGGIAFAISLGLYLDMILLMIFLRRKVGSLNEKRIFVSFTKLLIGSIFATAAMYLLYRFMSGVLPQNNWYVALNFFVSFVLFTVVYLIILRLLKSEEITSAYFVIKKSVSRIKRK